MAETCGHRFRSITDVNQWLLNYWQIVSGNFYPQDRRFGRYYTIDRTKEYGRVLMNQSVKTVCLNDKDFGISEYEKLRPHVLDVFRRVFPERSSFEKKDDLGFDDNNRSGIYNVGKYLPTCLESIKNQT